MIGRTIAVVAHLYSDACHQARPETKGLADKAQTGQVWTSEVGQDSIETRNGLHPSSFLLLVVWPGAPLVASDRSVRSDGLLPGVLKAFERHSGAERLCFGSFSVNGAPSPSLPSRLLL